MALTEEKRNAMLAATREAAAILRDDLQYIRKVITNPGLVAADIRRITVLLRRLLIDGEISEVAAPRTGRVIFQVGEYSEAEHINPSRYRFYSGALPPLFQLPMDANGGMAAGNKEPDGGNSLILPSTNGPNAHRIEVRLDGFLNNQVARFDDQIIKRRHIIEYMAYKGYGVHTNGRNELVFDLIEKARYCLQILTQRGKYVLVMGDLGQKPENAGGSDLDLALLHLFSTAYYTCASPSVIELERFIELNG